MIKPLHATVVLASVVGLVLTAGLDKRVNARSLLYKPEEVNCSNPPARGVVVLPTQTYPIADYCGIPRQSYYYPPSRQRSPENSAQWGAPYREGENLCRDRRNGTDTVCVTPETANRLKWPSGF
jgi:hypothetical protein